MQKRMGGNAHLCRAPHGKRAPLPADKAGSAHVMSSRSNIFI